MSFFGMSKQGKDARTGLSAGATLSAAQQAAWYARAGAVQDPSKDQGAAQNFYAGAGATGMGTPADAVATGATLAPGTDAAIAFANKTLDTSGKQWKDISARMAGQNAATNTGVNANIQNTYAPVEANTTGTYGDIANTYGNLQGTATGVYGSGDLAYDQMQRNLNLMKPGSEFQQAQVARSFAPQMASTMGALNAGGIDPSSPQGIALRNSVATAQSEGSDAAAAAGTQQYVGALNSVQAQQEALKERGLQTDIGLTGTAAQYKQAGLNTSNQLALAQGGATQDQILRNAATVQAQENQNWTTNQQLNAEKMNEQNLGVQQRQQQAQLGTGFNQQQYQDKSQAAAGMLNISGQQLQDIQGYSGTAAAAGDAAAKGFSTVYGNESANSNWGGKMLLGAASGAASSYLTGGLAGAGGYSAAPASGPAYDASSAASFNQPGYSQPTAGPAPYVPAQDPRYVQNSNAFNAPGF
jgi:hypothetical protein